MWRVGIGLAAALILLANGLLEGVCTNRWRQPEELKEGIARLERVPLKIGEWHAESEEMDEAALTRAGVEGYLCRHYENQLTSKKVTMLLMCGRPGPLSVHTPDNCYKGAGYHQDGPIARWPQKYGNGSALAQFSRAKFSKEDATDGTSVRIEWSWGVDGQWQIPSAPRATFARLPVLFKLYIVQRETPASEKANEEVCRSFLEQLLPALDAALHAKD